MLPELIVSTMTLATLMLVAMSIMTLVLQVTYLRKTYMLEAKAARMERTLRAVQLPPSISETIGFTLNEKYSFIEAMDKLGESDIGRITEALEFLETLATGILSGLYDEDIAYSRVGDRIVFFYEKTKRFIYESQSRSGAGLYVQLTQLARNWQSRERHAGYRKLEVR